MFDKIIKQSIRNIIALITVLGAFTVVILLIFHRVPDGNKDTVNVALGFVLGGLVGGVSGFYFGASKTASNETPLK